MLCGAFLLIAYWSNIWKHILLLLKTKHYVRGGGGGGCKGTVVELAYGTGTVMQQPGRCLHVCACVCKHQKPMAWTPKAKSWQFTLGSMLGDNHRQPRTERWCRHKSVISRYGVSSPKRGNHAVAWVSLNMINTQDYQDQKACVHCFTRTAERCYRNDRKFLHFNLGIWPNL